MRAWLSCMELPYVSRFGGDIGTNFGHALSLPLDTTAYIDGSVAFELVLKKPKKEKVTRESLDVKVLFPQDLGIVRHKTDK